MKTHFYRPKDWHWLSLIGPDAQDFLHRITTLNVRQLSVGSGAPGFFLNAQGRIRAGFHLWAYREGEYGLEFAGGETGRWKSELLAAIDQYTFSEKMTLADVQELSSAWIFCEQAPATLEGLAPGKTLALDEEIRVCHHGDRDFGRHWISVWARGPRLDQWIDRTFPDALPATQEQLEHWRIDAVRPWVDREILPDATIPLEVGLGDGISSNKGCYPGQEVIERIVSVGSPAKRLALIQGKGPGPRPGDKLLNIASEPTEVGEVTSCAEINGGFHALALIRKIHARESLPVRIPSGAEATITRIAALP